MRNRCVCYLLLVVVGLAFLVPEAEAQRRRDVVRKRKEEPKPEKIFEPAHVKYAIVPKLTAGLLTGEVASDLDKLDINTTDKILYGFGCAFEWSPYYPSAFGLGMEVVWKSIPNAPDDWRSIRGISVHGSWLYRLSPRNRMGFFTHLKLGAVWVRLPDYYSSPVDGNSSLDLGRHRVIRLGFGHISYSSPRRSNRFEIYYEIINASDWEPEEDPGGWAGIILPYDHDVTYLGLEFSLGIGL